jgi:hypothetical protein
VAASQSVSIVGPRKIGKTPLLAQIEAEYTKVRAALEHVRKEL